MVGWLVSSLAGWLLGYVIGSGAWGPQINLMDQRTLVPGRAVRVQRRGCRADVRLAGCLDGL